MPNLRVTYAFYTIVISAILALFPAPVMAGQLSLTWELNTEPDIQGYYLYFGTQSGTYDAPGSPLFIEHPQAITTVTGLQSGQEYFFALTAVDESANRSLPGVEISGVISEKDPPSDTTPLVVTNLSVESGLTYAVIDNGLLPGATAYIDRSYTFTTSGIPGSVSGLTYIQTANNDKNSSGTTFLTFDVNQSVTVYVGHDNRITTKPTWLSSFTNTGEILSTTDTALELFSQTFPAGTITLGGNHQNGGGFSMYSVAIAPEGGLPSDTTLPTPPTFVSAVANSSTDVTVSWRGATDDVAVTGHSF